LLHVIRLLESSSPELHGILFIKLIIAFMKINWSI